MVAVRLMLFLCEWIHFDIMLDLASVLGTYQWGQVEFQ